MLVSWSMIIVVISGEKGVDYSWQSCRLCLQWLQWLHNLHVAIPNRKLQPDSNVLRIHIQPVMKGSHASEGSHASKMAQLRRYGQVQVSRNSSQRSWATRCRIYKDSLSTSNATTITKERRNVRLHVNCSCTIGTSLNLDLLCVPTIQWIFG